MGSRAMSSVFDQICCDECGVEITWAPVLIGGHPYCCQDCAVGLECDCASIDLRWDDDAEPFWAEGFEGSIDAAYNLDYGID